MNDQSPDAVLLPSGRNLFTRYDGPSPVVDEDMLLQDLALVLRTCGASPFFANPILTPTKACFPDAWAPSQTGVRILVKRLMLYAGLDKIEPRVKIYTDREALVIRRSRYGGEHHGVVACFMGIEDDIATFGCEATTIPRPDVLVGVLGHEVAHVFRVHHGVTVADGEREEQLTDITAVFLGFGIFACNASRTLERSITKESVQRIGYLPARAFSFLLACQVVARGCTASDTRRLQGFLVSDHKEYFREAFHGLEGCRSKLLHELGVEEREAERMAATAPTVPAAKPIIVEGIREDGLSLAAEVQEPSCPHCGETIDYKVEECPHCGFTLSSRRSCLACIAIVVVVLAVLAVLAVCLM